MTRRILDANGNKIPEKEWQKLMEQKVAKNMIVIKFGYDKLVLDVTNAAMLLNILSQAESVDGYNSEDYRIHDFSIKFEQEMISYQTYLNAKMLHSLDLKK